MNNNTTPQPDLDSYTDLTVGQILQRTREHYKQSIEQVEHNLRIRASQLIAIEQGDVANLPGRVYAIGFVRAYAEYLGLDGDKIVQLFKAQTVGRNAKPDLQFPVTYKDSKLPNVFIIIGCLVGIIALISYWSLTYKPTRQIEIIPPVPVELMKGTVSLLEKPAVEIAAPTTVSESIKETPKNQISLLVSADSWVEIKNARGQVLLREVLKPGDKYIVPEEKGLTLSTGNAGGITVFVDGKKKQTLGKLTEVRRGIVLDPKEFY